MNEDSFIVCIISLYFLSVNINLLLKICTKSYSSHYLFSTDEITFNPYEHIDINYHLFSTIS